MCCEHFTWTPEKLKQFKLFLWNAEIFREIVIDNLTCINAITQFASALVSLAVVHHTVLS